ncbi:hypothetical protein [Mycobacterium sp.]|uniref:hypothetical protein n=1 Tax=Mycobacterium sp. TaxID=1785 RepID=UPI003F970295
MKITAAMAADLDMPTEALQDHGTDIAHSLHQLTLDARPRYRPTSIRASSFPAAIRGSRPPTSSTAAQHILADINTGDDDGHFDRLLSTGHHRTSRGSPRPRGVASTTLGNSTSPG